MIAHAPCYWIAHAQYLLDCQDYAHQYCVAAAMSGVNLTAAVARRVMLAESKNECSGCCVSILYLTAAVARDDANHCLVFNAYRGRCERSVSHGGCHLKGDARKTQLTFAGTTHINSV